MRRTGLVVILAGIVLLQVSLVPTIRPLGVVPNLVLVAVVLVGLQGTVSQALWFALAGGLVLDLAGGASFGLQTGILMLAGLTTGLIHRTGLAADGLLAPALLTSGAVVAANLVLAISLVPVAGLAVILPSLRTVILESMLGLIGVVVLRPLLGALRPRESVAVASGMQS